MPKKNLRPYSALFPQVKKDRLLKLLESGLLEAATKLISKRPKLRVRLVLASQDAFEAALEGKLRPAKRAGYTDEEIAAALAVIVGEVARPK